MSIRCCTLGNIFLTSTVHAFHSAVLITFTSIILVPPCSSSVHPRSLPIWFVFSNCSWVVIFRLTGGVSVGAGMLSTCFATRVQCYRWDVICMVGVCVCVCRCTAKRVALELRSEHSATGSAGHGSPRPRRRCRRDVSHTHTRAPHSSEDRYLTTYLPLGSTYS